MAVCLPVVGVLGDVLPLDPLLAGMLCVSVILWPCFSLAAWGLIFGLPRTLREQARREAFRRRELLTDEAFGRLFPKDLAATAVRAELGRFIGRADVTGRLPPPDPVRAACAMAGIYPDDLDWAEFLFGLEARFGVRFPDGAGRDATVAELVAWCGAEAPDGPPAGSGASHGSRQ